MSRIKFCIFALAHRTAISSTWKTMIKLAPQRLYHTTRNNIWTLQLRLWPIDTYSGIFLLNGIGWSFSFSPPWWDSAQNYYNLLKKHTKKHTYSMYVRKYDEQIKAVLSTFPKPYHYSKEGWKSHYYQRDLRPHEALIAQCVYRVRVYHHRYITQYIYIHTYIHHSHSYIHTWGTVGIDTSPYIHRHTYIQYIHTQLMSTHSPAIMKKDPR